MAARIVKLEGVKGHIWGPQKRCDFVTHSSQKIATAIAEKIATLGALRPVLLGSVDGGAMVVGIVTFEVRLPALRAWTPQRAGPQGPRKCLKKISGVSKETALRLRRLSETVSATF